MQRIEIYRLPTASPDDVSGLTALLDAGTVRPGEIICVLGKTEGNGCVNDFSRGFATHAYTALLAARLGVTRSEVEARVQFIMSGGTEGVLTPHVTVFVKREVVGPGRARKGLVAGIASTRRVLPEELGTMTQLRVVESAVKAAIADAGIEAPADVHFVQIKCPLLTAEAILEASARGQHVVTHNTYASMGYSRAASALGVAADLGETEPGSLGDEVIGRRWDLFSRVASTSAGVEISHCEILVLGNAEHSASDHLIGHDVMEDAIDAAAVRRALASVGCGEPGGLDRVAGVYAKAEASPSGRIRGRRHTMIDDSDINHTRQVRAVVGAVIGSIIGDPWSMSRAALSTRGRAAEVPSPSSPAGREGGRRAGRSPKAHRERPRGQRATTERQVPPGETAPPMALRLSSRTMAMH